MSAATEHGAELAIDVRAIEPIGHSEGLRLAETEYQRVLDVVRSLSLDDWDRPTDCSAWSVKDIVVHLIGAAEGIGSFRELVHQAAAARRLPKAMSMTDRVNQVQVMDRRAMPIQELPERLATAFQKGLKGRGRIPALLRRIPIPADEFGRVPFGLLTDVIYTRDAFIHRVDISRAAGKPIVVTPEHAGRIFADVVRDWLSKHGRPVRLELEGAAGGAYQAENGPVIRLDAVEFCRVVSGRESGADVLKTRVMF
jgi:uncharacterized protein (TIGR03083 family)